jgi:mRNA interferase RelE/StbE
MIVVYSKEARKDLQSLDPSVSKRVIKKVKEFTGHDNPLAFAKSLSANLSGLYRFRVGDYRVVFSVDEAGSVTILTILHIAHRKDIYK